MPIELDRQNGTHLIYTREEAEDEGIHFVPWPMAEPGGPWALTDDDYVGECLKKKQYDRESDNYDRFFFTFSFARKWLAKKPSGQIVGSPELFFEDHHEKNAYHMTAPKTWQEAEVGRTRTKRTIKLYVKLFLATEGQLTDEDWRILGLMYRPDDDWSAKMAKKLFRQSEIQDAVAKELTRIMHSKGLDVEGMITQYEELRQAAMKKGKYNTAFRVLEVYRELSNLTGDEVSRLREEIRNGSFEDGDIEDADYEMIEERLEEEARK